MGSSRSIVSARAGVLLLLALAAGGSAGCTLAPAKVWNLEQLHEPDGTPRRRGDLKNDLEYMMTEALGKTGFAGGKSDPQAEERAERASQKRIKDPFGECLSNLVALAKSERDERVAALQVSAYAWLAVDCTYVLSRERCALELGGVARALGPAEAGVFPEPEPGTEPASPEGVKTHFDQLIEVVRGVGGRTLSEKCDEIRALPLDRQGTLRLLRATNELLSGEERSPAYGPLRGLRLDLARRATALALRAALQDPHGVVRAAALESAMVAFPAERARHLRWAVTEDMAGVEQREAVSLRALELLARYGLPPEVPPAEGAEPAPADPVAEWRAILVQILRLSIDGPHDAAACKALAKITGEPLTLRPEVWFERARAAAGAGNDGAPPRG